MRAIRLAAMIGLLGGSALSGAAYAQTATAQTATAQGAAPAAPAKPAAGAASTAVAPSGAAGKRAIELVEKHITSLHKRLGITAAQEPQWAVFAGVMRDNAARMEASYTERQARQASMTAVEDMRSYAAMERARAEDVERLVPPFDALYQAMSPEQRAAADKTFQDFQRGAEGARAGLRTARLVISGARPGDLAGTGGRRATAEGSPGQARG